MKEKVLIILFLIQQLVVHCSAQESSLKNRCNFKLGFSSYPAKDEYSTFTPTLRAEGNYGINKFIETGLYLGVGRVEAMIFSTPTSAYGEFKTMSFFGINANFHLLPLITKKDDSRFDLYIKANLGGHYCNVPEGNFPSDGIIAEYGIGLGLSYYIFDHWGLFAEYSYGEFDYFDEQKYFQYEPVPPTELRYGIKMKFK